jgi:ribosomal protein S18 acetylase RimI-like enzyme
LLFLLTISANLAYAHGRRGAVMSQESQEIDYRQAGHDDETDVLGVLEEVASEVPVRLDGTERQEKIKIVIVECHASGKSLVAVAGGKVVGFVLARPDVDGGKAAIFVNYLGVGKGSRRRGIFAAMMEKMKAKGVRILAEVLHENKSGMAGRLKKIGFAVVETNAKQTRFRWTPP